MMDSIVNASARFLYRILFNPANGFGHEAESISLPSLERNYPNPFSTIATIRCALPKAGIVHLRMFDIRGGLVSELASGEQTAGMHAVPFDGGSLPSGVYLIRLEAEGSILTRSMTLMK